MDKLAISIQELAPMPGISEAILYKMANQGTLPGCKRMGKRFVIVLAVFEKWLNDPNSEPQPYIWDHYPSEKARENAKLDSNLASPSHAVTQSPSD